MSAPAPWLAVVGPAQADEQQLARARRVGQEVAAHGAVLVCGGLGGVMEAACRGAAGGGAVTVGLLPGADRADANPWVSVAIPTGLGELRNALVVRSADALVAVGGGWGTLSEIALALRDGVPVIGMRTWQPTRGGERVPGVVEIEDPAQAVAEALRRAGRRRHGRQLPPSA